MTELEIAALFVEAAEIGRKLPKMGDKPAALKAQSIPYYHSNIEKAGWIPADYLNGEPIPGKSRRERMAMKRNAGDQLDMDDRGRLDEEAEKFWQGGRVSPEQVTLWERSLELMTLVATDERRRALWAWAAAKAGGEPFARWCRREGIAEMTGNRRRNRAIADICGQLLRKTSQREQNDISGVLPCGPDLMDISVNIGNTRPAEKPVYAWSSDPSLKPISCPELQDFSWAAKRNEARRARMARHAA